MSVSQASIDNREGGREVTKNEDFFFVIMRMKVSRTFCTNVNRMRIKIIKI